MAFISQDKKKEISTQLTPILKKHGVKATLSIRNHMVLVLTIREGAVDFMESFGNVNHQVAPPTYIDVNPYHYQNHFDGPSLNFLNEAFHVLNHGNWDKSDISTDYFNVGWYVEVHIGKWNKPYRCTNQVGNSPGT